MLDWTAAIVAGVGLLILAGLVLAVLVPLRRFTRAAAGLRANTARGMLALRAVLNSPDRTNPRGPGDEDEQDDVAAPRSQPGWSGRAA